MDPTTETQEIERRPIAAAITLRELRFDGPEEWPRPLGLSTRPHDEDDELHSGWHASP